MNKIKKFFDNPNIAFGTLFILLFIAFPIEFIYGEKAATLWQIYSLYIGFLWVIWLYRNDFTKK